MSNNIPIRTRAIGGFDKQQVDDYLAELSAEYELAASKGDFSAIRSEISELKKTLAEKEAKLTQLKNTAAKYEEDDGSKPDFDNLTDSAKKFIDAHNEVVKIADETSGYINSTERKLPALLKSLTQITKNIDELGKELSAISDQIGAIPIEEKSAEPKPTEKDIFDTFIDEFKI
ncbi:MAG TPA: hypothetical protein DCY31_03125 [Ruminococcaceae bacterium]|nr:hypothetical protein [Oscillospiraceae bacterium]